MAVQATRIARARDLASQEAATATQVSDFLVGLFKVSDPSEARGTTLTAREILAKGVQQLDSLQDQPAVQARLQATIGLVETELGLYKDAQPLLETALQTQRRVVGQDHPDTLASANALANLYWFKGSIPRRNHCIATSWSGERGCWAQITRTHCGRTMIWPACT